MLRWQSHGAGLLQQPHRGCGDQGNRDGSTQGWMVGSSCSLLLLELGTNEKSSCAPAHHLEKPHQTTPCPVLSTPAALLDQMKRCILPQSSIKPPNPSRSRLEPLQPPEAKELGRDRAAGLLCWFWWLGRAWQRCSMAQTELGPRTAHPRNTLHAPETFTWNCRNIPCVPETFT